MSLGERQFQPSLRYPINNQRTPPNEINQTTFANNLYQQIVDKNKNNYLPTSNFSSMNNSYNQSTSTFTTSNSQFSNPYSSNIFSIQLTSLESKINGNYENFINIENQNANISSKIIETNQSIQELISKFENFSSFQINSSFQPLSDKNRSNRNEIESFFSNFNSSNIQFINQSLNEFASSFFIFDDKFTMFSNNLTKSEFLSLRRELNKIKNITKSNLNQIGRVDATFDTRIIKANQKIVNSFEETNSKALKNFELFQNNASSNLYSIPNEISEVLKQVSNDRSRIVLSYQKQIEGIQNNVKKPLLQFQSSLKNFQKENSPILNDLKESIKKSLDISQDECSQMILNLNNSYESVINETVNNFNGLQTEISKTINYIREKNENEVSSMLNVIECELKNQKENFIIEKDKIAKFLNALNDQFELNFDICKKIANETEKNGIIYFNNLYEEKIRPKILPFKNIESNLNCIEKRIVDCENSIDDLISKMKINIRQANNKVIEITKSFDEIRILQKNRFDLIDNEIRNIEVKKNELNIDKKLIPSNYIRDVNSQIVDELNKKTIELEYQYQKMIYFIQKNGFINIKTEKTNKNKKLEISKSKSNNSKDENADAKEFTSSQLYSDSIDYYTTTNNESDEGDETYSTNTITENPKNNKIQNKIKNNETDSYLQDNKNNLDNWNIFSNSDADDEDTEEFTFNKSLNNSKKS